VFSKFKACLTVEGVSRYRAEHDAITIVYKSLQDDADKADISAIIRQLHEVVGEAVEVRDPTGETADRLYDISKIDFERLRREFERSQAKNTTVQSLKTAIEKR